MLPLVWLAACSVGVTPCSINADCVGAFDAGWTCNTNGLCIAPAATEDPLETNQPGDTPDTGMKVFEPVLLINEVLYDPSNESDAKGPLGDANGDGKYVHDEDEFVEFVNISGRTADVSGYALYDIEAWDLEDPRHVMPSGTVLAAGEALVVFGGGKPKGDFGGAQVQVADRFMNLNNENDELRVTDAEGRVVLTFDVASRSNDPDESYTRNPDVTGNFEQHGDRTELLYSPGTRVDGKPLLE